VFNVSSNAIRWAMAFRSRFELIRLIHATTLDLSAGPLVKLTH
jgi:hypothetical protein